jgi:NAD(P)-dependent dehydrogenase (short-subunit alcohol dehydrogenase family)
MRMALRRRSLTSKARDVWGLAIVTELGDPQATEIATEHTLKASPAIDVLVNGAGMSCSGNLFNNSVKEWDEVLAVDLRAPWPLARAIRPRPGWTDNCMAAEWARCNIQRKAVKRVV